MRVSLILSIVLFHSALAQDTKVHCGNDTIRCNNGGKKHFEPIVNCPYVEYPDTAKVPVFICDINRKYLSERMGVFFYSKVKFRGCDVIEPEKYSELKNKRGFTDKASCNGKIKYAFEYYFMIQDSMKFYFTTIYDEKGNLLSKSQTPDIRQNPDCMNIVDVCEAKTIAEADTEFKGKMTGISLEYSQKYNSFVWVVEKPREIKDKKVISRFVIIHAQSRKILDHITRKGTLVCALPSF